MTRRLTSSFLALLAIGVAACGPRVPATRPAPQPTTTPAPTTSAPATTTTPVEPAVAGAASVIWAPGYSSYVVTSQAAVHVEGDTTIAGGVRDDSVATRARLTMRVSPTS